MDKKPVAVFLGKNALFHGSYFVLIKLLLEWFKNSQSEKD